MRIKNQRPRIKKNNYNLLIFTIVYDKNVYCKGVVAIGSLDIYRDWALILILAS